MMIRLLIAGLLAGAGSGNGPAPLVPLRAGMVITHSVRITPGTYALRGTDSMDSAVITIRGNDITVDFNGAVLRGIDPTADPDGARGVGVRIDGGTNVRVVNARVHGYKVGLLARHTRGLTIGNSDFSYNWKPRLLSLIEHESLADWLSHHHDENGEWLRFGAGIFLSDVRGGELRGNRIEQGMEGLMLERTDSVLIWNNVIEFNSGVGIGLYRSSYNRIMNNHASYNVRGFSRYYRRGQDSADLLMYEQSSHNLVAYNSMTHGGDGLFIWAGQSTMDTGIGGVNDNLFYANDFSFAPANAMEATFSRNDFIGNYANGSDYGMWGGYSYDSKIEANFFNDNRTGVAIEHGQNNHITDNRFLRDTVGIYLWADKIEPSEWGYPKHRETGSQGYDIQANFIGKSRVGLRVRNTRTSNIADNIIAEVDTPFVSKDSSTTPVSWRAIMSSLAFEPSDPKTPVPAGWGLEKRMPGALEPGMDAMRFAIRDAIVVDEWGPYSWTYPRLWPLDSTHANPMKLLVLGQPGTWRVVSGHGVATMSRTSGTVIAPPASSVINVSALRARDTLVVTPAAGFANNWDVTLEYRGAATVSPRGVRKAAGAPYRFTYEHFEPVTQWDVAFHIWPDSADPRAKAAAFDALLHSTPLLTRTEPRLDYMWYGPAIKGLPQEKWAAVASARVTLPAGEYTLRSISDDGARVYVDGKLVLDDWAPHESAVGNARITPGTHDIRVEYYQIDGWSELRVEIVKGIQSSSGSPGPH